MFRCIRRLPLKAPAFCQVEGGKATQETSNTPHIPDYIEVYFDA